MQVYIPSAVKVFEDVPWAVFICCFSERFRSHVPQTWQVSHPLMVLVDLVVTLGNVVWWLEICLKICLK